MLLNLNKDLQSTNKPQYYVLAKSIEYYKETLFDKNDIPGSEQSMASSPIHKNLIKQKKLLNRSKKKN